MVGTLVYLLYWIVQALAFPILLLYLGTRVVRTPQYKKRIRERFGFWQLTMPPPSPDRIWIHAVSVGEVLTALPLIRRLREGHPTAAVYVSCTTLAGREIADVRLGELVQGVFYAPLDYRNCVRRVLRRIRPTLVVVLETEIWPNLYRDARKYGARLMVVNGRISDKAISRYSWFRWFFGPVLRYADAILAQSAVAFERYRELGAMNVENAGNLKFDFEPEGQAIHPDIAGALDACAARELWIAASTMPPELPQDPDEDDVFIEVWREMASRHPDSVAILAPRRPQRFEEAAAKLAEAGVPFVRRTQLPRAALPALPAVLLLDSLGELASLYSRAGVVFMGGTLAHRGGHNPLEPAAFGVPVVAGPHMENFQEIADEFTRAGAMVRVRDAAEVARAVGDLFRDEPRRRAIGRRSREIAEWRRGATARAVSEMLRLLSLGLARPCPSWPRSLALWPLSLAWRAGVALHRWTMSFYYSRLPRPTISVGNLAMGGTGKSPFTLWLARRLRDEGLRPAILTRGYRRRRGAALAVLLPGEQAGVEVTGEEAQMYLREGHAVGVGANRWAAGRALMTSWNPGVFLLDDGFQHWAIRRKVEIVLIDVIDPFRGGVFPLGRSREPFRAVERADAVVLTRTEPGRRYTALEDEVRKYNPKAPIFYSRLAPQGIEGRQGRPGAFCGLGQPESFAQSLAALGIQPVFFKVFPDHHRYGVEELQPLRDASAYLVTTEKDLWNIPGEVAQRLDVVAIHAQVVVDDGDRLVESIALRADNRLKDCGKAADKGL